ncbi:hypothetical protein B0H11DRAFT_2421706 [Mycena galericulata]|nr:hypothetical protein B0H11DRAFT_2421706 [Mycena galericulata]
MPTTAAVESRYTPSQFEVPPRNLSGPVGADTATPSLDDPARREPPTPISGGTSTSRTTGSINPDSIPAETPSRGAVIRKRTRDSTPQPDDPAHSDPLKSMSGSPSTFRITGRTDPVTTTSNSPSTSRRTGFSRDSAPAATSSPGAVLQRSPGDSTLMDMGHRLDDQVNESRELSRNLMILSHRLTELEAKIADDGRSERPEVKITPWRALNTVFLLVVGAYKAATTYLGQTMGPTTADWIIGVVWALIAYWVTFYEDLEADEKLGHPSWFFTYDLSGVLYQNLEYLLYPFFLFGVAAVSFKVIDKLDPETPFWAAIFLPVVAGAGYPAMLDLLPKLKLGKLLRQSPPMVLNLRRLI